MKNREKYADEIIDIAVRSRLALKDGKPFPCASMKCSECGFHSADFVCNRKSYEWLDSEYVAPLVDWSKVAVDTLILVRGNEGSVWRKRYFAKFENGKVYAWLAGATSWSVDDNDNITDWKFAKLAESEE